MGLFDFLFGNKKKQEERLERERQERLQRERDECIAREREARLAENRRKEAERTSITPFEFKSNCHQRYEKGNPVMGLQKCIRTVSVEKNTNGCRGYKLEPGDGYIVKIYNDDMGRPNMSDKPMRVLRKTETSIELRGFPIEAQSPFGWQEVDYRDYGLVVYYESGKVSKCVLHMYDRNTYIEYSRQQGEVVDKYTQMIKDATFNPFNLTIATHLQPPGHLPNIVDVLKNELRNSLSNPLLNQVQSKKDIAKGYIFNLIESYYNNSGYVPKKTLDDILNQSYQALVEIDCQHIFSSKDELFYHIYYCLLNN